MDSDSEKGAGHGPGRSSAQGVLVDGCAGVTCRLAAVFFEMIYTKFSIRCVV